MESAIESSLSPSKSVPALSIPKCCPVCMRKLKKCELGKPATCSHVFCFICLYEWSKNVNTCPVDRVKFNIIEVFDVDGNCSRQVTVEDHSLEQVLVDPYGLTYCEVCGQCTREDRLLLCDGCDKGYHMTCLVPKLKRIPAGNWYCRQCEPIVRGILVSSDTVDDSSSSESEQENAVVLEDKQLELPQTSLALACKDDNSNVAAVDEDGKDFEKPSFSSSESHQLISVVASQAQSSASLNDSDTDFMTSRDQHPNPSVASDNQHIVLKRGGYLVNKRKRKHKKSLNLDHGQNGLISNTIREFDFLGSGSSSRGARVPSSPRSRARTVATGGQAPSVSIRQAVIASHRCSSSQDGLVAAQRIAQGVWQAPAMSTVRQKRPNAHQRSQNLTVPMRYCSVKLDKLPLDRSSKNTSPCLSPCLSSSVSNVLHSSPTHNPPIDLTSSPPKRLIADKLDFSRPSTTDYVGAICQGLDNLQAKEHIFHRDGSIEAVQPKIRVPIKTRKKVALEMARYSQENEASRSQYIWTHSRDNTSSYSTASFCLQDSQASSSRTQDTQGSSSQDAQASCSSLGSCPQASGSHSRVDQDPNLHDLSPSESEQNFSLCDPEVYQNDRIHDDTQSVAMETSEEVADCINAGSQSKKGNPRTRRRRRRRQVVQHAHLKVQSIWQQEQQPMQLKPHTKRQQEQPIQLKPQQEQQHNSQQTKRKRTRLSQSRRLSRCNGHTLPAYYPTAISSLFPSNTMMYQTPHSTTASEKAIPCVPLFPELSNRVHTKQEPQLISSVQPPFSCTEQENCFHSTDCFFDSPSRPQPLFSHFYSDSCEDKHLLFQSVVNKTELSETNSTPFQTQMSIKSEPSTDTSEHHYMCDEPSLDFNYPEPSESQYRELDSAYPYNETTPENHYSCDLLSTPNHYENHTPGQYPPTECENQLPPLRALFPRSCRSPQQSMDCSDWSDAAAADHSQIEANCPAMSTDTACSSDMCLSSPSHFYESFWQSSSDSPAVAHVNQMDDSETALYYGSHKLKIHPIFHSFLQGQNTASSDNGMYTPVYPVEPMKNDTLLDCQLAGEYVMKLLEHYRQKGYIPKELVHRITEKALRKVQKTKHLVPEARVKKLVDEYIAIYSVTTHLT